MHKNYVRLKLKRHIKVGTRIHIRIFKTGSGFEKNGTGSATLAGGLRNFTTDPFRERIIMIRLTFITLIMRSGGNVSCRGFRCQRNSRNLCFMFLVYYIIAEIQQIFKNVKILPKIYLKHVFQTIKCNFLIKYLMKRKLKTLLHNMIIPKLFL